MKTILIFLCLVAPANARLWLDCTELHTTEAELVTVGDDTVKLRKPDGTMMTISIDKFSNKDIAFIHEHAAEYKDKHAPPAVPKAPADKGSDEVNEMIKSLHAQLESVVSQQTSVRVRAAYATVLTRINERLQAKTYAFRFPITDVADDRYHTLSLDAPEGINGLHLRLTRYIPTWLGTDKALKVNPGNCLILRGKAKLLSSNQAEDLYNNQAGSTICVADFFDANSHLYYGFYLQNYAAKIDDQKVVFPNAPVVAAIPVPVPPPVRLPFGQPQNNAPAAVPEQPGFGQPGFGQFPPPVAQPQNAPLPVANLPVPPQVATQPPPRWTPPTPQIQNPPVNQQPQGQITGTPVERNGQWVYQQPTRNDYTPTDPDSAMAKYIRKTLTPEKFANRQQRLKKKIGTYYEYLASQTSINVGCDYSGVFWASMMYWSIQRRALWLYHNQYTIRRELYEQQLQNPDILKEIDKLRSKGTDVDSSYIDPDYKDDPDLMFTVDAVDAIYHYDPDFRSTGEWGIGWAWLVIGAVVATIALALWSKS